MPRRCASSIASDVAAQSSPLFETRGVWFATVLRDGNWPVSVLDSATKQEADLRERIQHAKALGLNTFVFQAVARGDAMYPSSRLPWSARLGSAGVDPGYDPLAVAIDEAHRLGMELHAWINVNRVGDVNSVADFSGASNPGHVFYEHPGWVQSVSGALRLDASAPEAR
ncbi:MAG: family 10 glycosylhydrolase [Rhodothermales bacterium]|nr:family 10 glycosylhydrolase [Rhodothermales bacterium]